MNEETERTDWVHPPAKAEVRSLWVSLHDSTVLSCESDLLNRTVALRFASRHLVENNPDITFDLVLSEVTSARATIMARWPGEYVRPKNISREAEHELIREYQAKWRQQSLGWADFEASLRNNVLEVGDASLAIGADTKALKFGGMLDGDTYDDLYCEVCIAFKSLSITSSENVALTLEAFEQLGTAYWEAFARRAPRE